jgi:hypothetical protein
MNPIIQSKDSSGSPLHWKPLDACSAANPPHRQLVVPDLVDQFGRRGDDVIAAQPPP